MFEFWFLLAVRASHPHLRIPSSRAHLHLRTSCLNDFAQFVRRPIAYTPNTEVLGALVLLRPHSQIRFQIRLRPLHTHILTDTLAYLFSCSLQWVSASIRQLYTLHPKCKTLSYGRYEPGSLACDASHGVCRFSFSTSLVAGLLPPMRVFGLLNMRAYLYVNAYAEQCPRLLLAPPTMQCFASDRPFARTGVCKHVNEHS